MLSSLDQDPELTPRIHAAIDATKKWLPEHWEDLCTRSDPRLPGATGGRLSIRPDYTGPIEDVIRVCAWSKFTSDLPPENAVFRTLDLAGRIGVVALKSLNPYLEVRIEGKNGKNGFAEASVFWSRKELSPYTTIVLHPVTTTEGPVECVWTFHPGPPNYPSIVLNPEREVETIPVFEALNRGLRWARCLA